MSLGEEPDDVGRVRLRVLINHCVLAILLVDRIEALYLGAVFQGWNPQLSPILARSWTRHAREDENDEHTGHLDAIDSRLVRVLRIFAILCVVSEVKPEPAQPCSRKANI